MIRSCINLKSIKEAPLCEDDRTIHNPSCVWIIIFFCKGILVEGEIFFQRLPPGFIFHAPYVGQSLEREQSVLRLSPVGSRCEAVYWSRSVLSEASCTLWDKGGMYKLLMQNYSSRLPLGVANTSPGFQPKKRRNIIFNDILWLFDLFSSHDSCCS